MVRAFLAEMALALAAADVAVSRAGASSLAEFAACGLPAILIPYPTAADNHQYHNALAFAHGGAARALPQEALSPALLTREIRPCWATRPGARPCGRPCAPGIGRRPRPTSPTGCSIGPRASKPLPDSWSSDANAPKLGVLNV